MTAGNHPKILIADDSSTLRKILRGLLEEISPDVIIHEASDGAQTLQMVSDYSIDVIFLDVNMPEISGIEALQLLRKKGDNIFVTLMSTEADEAVIAAGSELGSYDFLKKPFGRDEVERILRSHRNLSQRKNVLVVDDSSTIRRLICTVLNNCQFDMLISEVDSGNEALTLLKGTRPDIVFLDYQMPGLNGIEAAHRLRAESPGLKLVLISAHDLSDQIEECRKAGIFSYIKKPFFPNEVNFVLHRLYGLNMPQSLEKTPNVTLLDEAA